MNNDTPDMLDFVKAMSDPSRLRIIGALSQGPLTAAQVAAAIQLPFRKTVNHLAFLSFVGIVLAHPARKQQEVLYELDAQFLEHLARHQFEGRQTAYAPPPDEAETTRKVLATYLNPDGSIRQIPNSRTQAARFRIILEYVAGAFATGRNYTEREVNAILARFNEDTSGLRRDLVDAGMLARERDGSRYWRPQ
jgi:ArsR family transcriptional regulator